MIEKSGIFLVVYFLYLSERGVIMFSVFIINRYNNYKHTILKLLKKQECI